MKPTKIYTFAVPANGAFSLLVQGDYFRLMSATGAIEVRGDTFGTIGSILAGQGMRDTPFNRIEFRDVSGSANNISVLVADATFVDDRITGEVSVIDGSKARSIVGASFQWRPSSSSIAGNRPFSQLWNPPGSGRRIVVDRMTVGNGIAGGISWGLYGAALAAASTDPICNISSLVQGAVTASPRVDQGAAYLPMSAAGTVFVPANGTVVVDFRRPFVVAPGVGFTLFAETAGAQQVSGCIEFFEEAIL